MTSENRQCQNCKQTFTIEPADFDFYMKIDVPAPTFCPDCRMVRRFVWRNERSWHKRKCDATGKDILSMIAPDKPHKVYEQNYYRSDAWDPMGYGREVDLARPFLAQFQELFVDIPHPNLVQKNNVSSDYSNYSLNLKNCYQAPSVDTAEDCAYIGGTVLRAKSSLDLNQSTDSEFSYELVDCTKSNKLRFCQTCEGCADSYLLYDCRNCSDCVGCVGLRSKQYCIFNQQYSKDEYLKKVQELKLDTYSGLAAARDQFEQLKMSIPRKYANIIKSKEVVGDDIMNSRDVQGFNIRDNAEHVRYAYRVHNSSDVWDGFVVWNGAELVYEGVSCSGQRIFMSQLIWGGSDVYYSYNCFDCTNIFGCVGLRNKSYCILNKQYTKEEYFELVAKLKKHMSDTPYRDERGLVYGYGEFLPVSFSPFGYNETVAQELCPIISEAAAQSGYPWRKFSKKEYKVTLRSEQLPDAMSEVSDAILSEVIECAHAGSACEEMCSSAFKLIPMEIMMYRQLGVPLPRLCPNCRHFQRVKSRNPIRLWERACMCAGSKSVSGLYVNTRKHEHGDKACRNTFKSPYEGSRPENVYCESCYNSEIV